MAAPRSPFGWTSLLALVIATAGFATAMWVESNRRAVVHPGLWMAVGMALFFIGFTIALFRYLRWRDVQNGVVGRVPAGSAQPVGPAPVLHAVYDLHSGQVYQVIRTIDDYHGGVFSPGERLTFSHRHFLPYHGGHTLIFEERPMYLQEQAQQHILEALPDYLVAVDADLAAVGEPAQ